MPVYTPIVYNGVQVTHDGVPVVLAESGAHLAVRGVTNPGDIESAYAKGDIVSVFDAPLTGAAYVPPQWVRVNVTDATAAEVLEYIDSWLLVLGYDILQTDLTIDRALIKSFTENPGNGNEYGITWNDIEPFVESWSGVFYEEPAANDVRFSIAVADTYKSEGFWGADPVSQGVIITDVSYVEATGTHTTEIDISSSDYDAAAVKDRIERLGGVIISTSPDTEEAVVEFYRDEVVPRFLAALREFSLEGIRRRRYYIDEATVDNGIAAGGYIEVTKAQLNLHLIDKAAE